MCGSALNRFYCRKTKLLYDFGEILTGALSKNYRYRMPAIMILVGNLVIIQGTDLPHNSEAQARGLRAMRTFLKPIK